MSSRIKRFLKQGIPTRVKHPTGHEEKKNPTPAVFRKGKPTDDENTIIRLLSGHKITI